jgi:hypothetical protein
VDVQVQGLLDEQLGVATAAQLVSAGMTRSALRWRLERDWRWVLPRVVATRPGPLSGTQALVAAQLFAGHGAFVTSHAAAAWHGVTSAQSGPPVHVAVPVSCRRRSAGYVVVRRTTRPELHPFRRGPLLLASRARAVADAARDCRQAEQAREIVIEATQRRLVRVEDLRHELEAGARRGSALLRAGVQDAEAGAWSVPEADLAALVRASGVLPPIDLNPTLVAPDGTVLPTPDGWLDDVGLALLVHSRRFHADGDDWDETVLSDGVYAEFGVPALPLTPRRIRSEPARVLQRIERAHAVAGRRGRPDVRAIPRGHGLVS